jgi:hypothetical protein
MGSITTSKKEIIDFLWEWGEANGDWGKLLIDKIVSSESKLSDSDRLLVFNYFLQSINLYSGLPASNITKPIYIPSSKSIELTSLSNIEGVNKLAKNQNVDFSPNLTVIYGENATGKSGYSRILKALGFSYDRNNNIYSNIYGGIEPKSATIKFRVNGVDDTFIWDGNNRNPNLDNISVFNSDCVLITLSDRQLIVSPIGFHLFELVSNELNALERLLDEKIAGYPTYLSFTEQLIDGTPQHSFITSINDFSSKQRLAELSKFTSENESELNKSEIELSNLNKTLLENEIQNLQTQLKELFSLGTFDHMIVFRHCGGILNVKKYIDEVIVDKIDLNKSESPKFNLFHMGFGALVLAKSLSGLTIGIKTRSCSPTCICDRQYKRDRAMSDKMFYPKILD